MNNEISVFNKNIIILDLDRKKRILYHQIDVIQIDLDNDFTGDEDFLLDEIAENEKKEKNQSKYNYKNYRNFNYEQNQTFEKNKEEEIDLPTHYKKKTYNLIMAYLKILAKNQNQAGR